MTEDFIVEPRSTKKIEEITLAWRDTLGVANTWAPNMIDLIENKLPVGSIDRRNSLCKLNGRCDEAKSFSWSGVKLECDSIKIVLAIAR